MWAEGHSREVEDSGRRANPREGGGRTAPPARARSPRRRAIYAPDTDNVPIPAATGQLLKDLGIDVTAVRETFVDDLAWRCADGAPAQADPMDEEIPF